APPRPRRTADDPANRDCDRRLVADALDTWADQPRRVGAERAASRAHAEPAGPVRLPGVVGYRGLLGRLDGGGGRPLLPDARPSHLVSGAAAARLQPGCAPLPGALHAAWRGRRLE